MEVFAGVSQRYQPNVSMANLTKVKVNLLPEVIDKVSRVFNDACRCIEGHSQPLTSLGVTPTPIDLEKHWHELRAVRDYYRNG